MKSRRQAREGLLHMKLEGIISKTNMNQRQTQPFSPLLPGPHFEKAATIIFIMKPQDDFRLIEHRFRIAQTIR
jgi:hypothetical protein